MASSIALDSTAQASFETSVKNIIKNEKLLKQAARRKSKKGVVYITHIPHGFYEEQMKGYFGQFGRVTNVKLARSKKSGKSKGFAFIEFEHEEVAQVVAETMNNYIMCNRLLKAEYIPWEKVKGKSFWKTNVTAKSYPRLRNRKRDTRAKNSEKSEEKVGMLLRKRHQHVEGIIEKLNAHGISYTLKEFDAPPKAPISQSPPVLEIDKSDDEIEFRVRPDFTVKKRFLKKSKKTSSKKRKIDSSGNEVINDESCRSPESKLHLMNVKKNLFGNYEKSRSKPDKKPSCEEHLDTISSLPGDDGLSVLSGKSTTKVACNKKTKEPKLGTQSSPKSTSLGKGKSQKSAPQKGKKAAEKFSARLQKKLRRSRTARLEDAGASESVVDKFAKKLKRARKSTPSKATGDCSHKKFSSKKLSIKGKLRGFAELGM